MKTTHTLALAISAVAIASLTACGGSSDSDSSASTGTTSTSGFPTGVSVASPTSLTSSTSVVASLASPAPATVVADWARAAWDAARAGDTQELAQLASRVLPFGRAWAGTDKVPEAVAAASEIEAVAKGGKSLAQIGLTFNHLFTTSTTNAACFGPSVDYAGHDFDASSGTLPSGDLGMWVATDTATSQPCAAAELNARLDPVKKQTRQAMLLMAAMRRIIAVVPTLSMPTAGTTTTVTTPLSAVLLTVDSAVSVNAATVSLDGTGTEYTYRLVLTRGTGATAESAEVVINHTPGASSTQFTGVMSLTVSQLLPQTGPNNAFGCVDQTSVVSSTSYYKTAHVTTLRYDRNGTTLKFGARTGRYCGAPTSSGSGDHLGDVASIDSQGELDPTVHLGGSSTRGSTLGWRGDFSQFAGDLNKDTQAGDFVYVWQAGNLDGAGRGFAVHAAFNTSTELRSLNAYYGYTDALSSSSTTAPNLLGMICNWAGPGNNHTPNGSFQSQAMTLGSTASSWTLGTSKITYAPTNSCNSSAGMTFDANANGSIASGEGASVTNDLDSKGSSSTVEAEIEARGYTQPTLF